MKYIDHWMKGKYEWSENHEKSFIYLRNSRARDLRKRAWDTADLKPRVRVFQTLL